MEFSDDVVFAILNFLRENNACDLLSFRYSEIPGGYSNQQIAFHLEDSRDNGYVKGDFSADKIMALAHITPAGLKRLQIMDGMTPQVVTTKEYKHAEFPEGSIEGNEAKYVAANHSNFVDQEHEKLQVFISHSGKDFKLAKPLADLIQKSMRLSHNAIRCSSVDGYKLRGGISTDERLRIEVHEAMLLIGLITPNSLKSLYVAFELGARWGSDKPMIPLLAAGVSPSHLEGPLSGINALSCDNPSQITQLIEELAFHLKTEHESISSCTEEIDQLANLSSEFTKEINSQHFDLNPENDLDNASPNTSSIRASWDAINLSPAQQVNELDPGIAVIKLCAYITSSINYLIESDRDIFGTNPPKSARWRIDNLREAGVIDHELASIIYDLIGSRNAIAHGENLPVHPENLSQFANAANRMKSIVSSRKL